MGESFFEFRAKLTQKPDPPAPSSKNQISVTQLTQQIERAIKALPQTFHVRGEISNFNAHAASGHLYFTLKDANSCIDCVMWKSDAVRLKFTPKDGMELLATGGVKIYPLRGRYQLYVSRMEPLGQGALELAFKQLCAKLESEGLFSPTRKKPIPPYPRRIAIVTAAQAAALHDMLKVLRRFRFLRLFLYPVPVQGEGAGARIAAALKHLSSNHRDIGGIDLILLGRGGGSLEDLWAFNEEAVARAIAASKVPVVTGIGHEVDTSIADLVADYHAHTPTEAAQVITSQWRAVPDQLAQTNFRLGRSLRDQFLSNRQRLDAIRRHEFFRRPMDLVNALRQRLDDRQHAMRVALNAKVWSHRRRLHELEQSLATRHPRHAVTLARQTLAALENRLRSGLIVSHEKRAARLDSLERALRVIGHESVLRRGFSITTIKKDGALIRSTNQLRGGERIVTRVADGSFESVADDPKQPKLF